VLNIYREDLWVRLQRVGSPDEASSLTIRLIARLPSLSHEVREAEAQRRGVGERLVRLELGSILGDTIKRYGGA